MIKYKKKSPQHCLSGHQILAKIPAKQKSHNYAKFKRKSSFFVVYFSLQFGHKLGLHELVVCT